MQTYMLIIVDELLLQYVGYMKKKKHEDFNKNAAEKEATVSRLCSAIRSQHKLVDLSISP